MKSDLKKFLIALAVFTMLVLLVLAPKSLAQVEKLNPNVGVIINGQYQVTFDLANPSLVRIYVFNTCSSQPEQCKNTTYRYSSSMLGPGHYVRALDVPDGCYQADLYINKHLVNGIVSCGGTTTIKEPNTTTTVGVSTSTSSSPTTSPGSNVSSTTTGVVPNGSGELPNTGIGALAESLAAGTAIALGIVFINRANKRRRYG